MSYFEDRGYTATLLCWVKTNPIPTMNGNYLSDIEYCVYVRDKGVTFNNDVPYDYKRKAYISGLVSTDRFHPAQKPDELIKRYLSVHSKEGDTVLDCFMGSGTTGVWCKKLGRDFIGIEIDKKYYDIAEKRIGGAHKEVKLF